eukprot:TRINITY_DN5336_c0_g1_i1.p1 TRINITY_DN5336_c0_g1~~TRINITY_DN5336_c0_g1_i1.p1  ORF type:complete len:425 (+),score=141.67 TRINITY_DN5336_c0_g1_i1:107-1381(+)
MTASPAAGRPLLAAGYPAAAVAALALLRAAAGALRRKAAVAPPSKLLRWAAAALGLIWAAMLLRASRNMRLWNERLAAAAERSLRPGWSSIIPPSPCPIPEPDRRRIAEAAAKGAPSLEVLERGGDASSFLAAARATTMQLAHPYIAEAIAEHSVIGSDAERYSAVRFFRTFGIMFPLWFLRECEQRRKALELFFRLHRRVRGRLSERVGNHPEGEEYAAADTRAVWWTAATLIECRCSVAALLAPSMVTDAHLEEVWQHAQHQFRVVGLPDEVIPQTWVQFLEEYTAMMREDLGVGSKARQIVEALRSSADRRGVLARGAVRRQFSMVFAWLPAPLRDMYAPLAPSGAAAVLWAGMLRANFATLSMLYPLVPAGLLELWPVVQRREEEGRGAPSLLNTVAMKLGRSGVQGVLGVPSGIGADWM